MKKVIIGVSVLAIILSITVVSAANPTDSLMQLLSDKLDALINAISNVTVIGPQGPVGPQGPQGEPGQDGQDGAQGPPGGLSIADANNNTIGFLLDFRWVGDRKNPTIEVFNSQYNAPVLYNLGTGELLSDNNWSPSVYYDLHEIADVYHTSNDCSGTAYIGATTPYFLRETQVGFWRPVSAPLTNLTVHSFSTGLSCHATSTVNTFSTAFELEKITSPNLQGPLQIIE